MNTARSVEFTEVLKELEKLDQKLEGKDEYLAWISFPYSENNLKIIKRALKKVDGENNLYRLSYDENDIFVEKDLYRKS